MFWKSGNLVGNQGNDVGTLPTWGWLLPMPWFIAVAILLRLSDFQARWSDDPEQAIADALAQGFELSASPSDVVLIDPPPPITMPWRHSRVWALAQHPGQANDVYLLHVQLTPEGQLLELEAAYNVTETTAADERHFRARHELAAWAVGDANKAYSLHLADAGRGPPLTSFSRRERWQLKLAWRQQIGQLRGLQHRHFKLDPPAEKLWLGVDGNEVRLWADGHQARVPRQGPPLEGGRFLDERPHHVARPGNLLTWAVDRARGWSWFGDDRMQLLKAVAYRLLDEMRVRFGWLNAEPELEASLTLDAAIAAVSGPRPAPANPTGPASDFPPPPLSPLLAPPLPGEGEWRGLDGDPFVRPMPDGSSPVYTTFIRTDTDRQFSHLMVALWDSRVMELSMQSGTEEPKTATGEHGTGLIPRDPDVLERLVLAFNGGFQGTHGNFGMMVDGVSFVPAKPYAATVAKLEDGSTGFGTWPAVADVPEQIVSFRQNLTPLIADGKANPYGRVFWGGAPEGWEDRTRTVRSGLCLTKRKHIAYLYGASVDHHALISAMQLLECDYGLHLDMNQGHTGLEFYHVDKTLKTLALPLDTMWQAEGSVSEAPDYRFRGRRLFKTMQLMNFPRYIQREARDFFYVTQRRLLPGKPLFDRRGTAIEWQHSRTEPETFPFALVRATFVPDPENRPQSKIHALKLDPRLLRLGTADGDAPPLLSWERVVSDGELHVSWTSEGPTLEAAQPPVNALLLASGSAVPTGQTRALLCRASGSGFLVYAEIGTGRMPGLDGALLESLLPASRCTWRVFLREPLGLGLSARTDLSGHPVDPTHPRVTLIKQTLPGAQRIFTDTPIVERQVWRPLQRAGTHADAK